MIHVLILMLINPYLLKWVLIVKYKLVMVVIGVVFFLDYIPKLEQLLKIMTNQLLENLEVSERHHICSNGEVDIKKC